MTATEHEEESHGPSLPNALFSAMEVVFVIAVVAALAWYGDILFMIGTGLG